MTQINKTTLGPQKSSNNTQKSIEPVLLRKKVQTLFSKTEGTSAKERLQLMSDYEQIAKERIQTAPNKAINSTNVFLIASVVTGLAIVALGIVGAEFVLGFCIIAGTFLITAYVLRMAYLILQNMDAKGTVAFIEGKAPPLLESVMEEENNHRISEYEEEQRKFWRPSVFDRIA